MGDSTIRNVQMYVQEPDGQWKCISQGLTTVNIDDDRMVVVLDAEVTVRNMEDK